MSVYRFTICHRNWLMLYSHAIIVYLGCCIPNLHLIMRTYYPIVLPFYLVWYTFYFVLLQIHFKAVFNLLFFFHLFTFCSYTFHSYTFHSYKFHLYTFHSYAFHLYTFICILFICELSISILFIRILFIRIVSILILLICIISFFRSSRRKCSIKFYNIHRKTTVLESLFNKVAGLKRHYDTRVFLSVFRNFQEFSICKRLLLIRILSSFHSCNL